MNFTQAFFGFAAIIISLVLYLTYKARKTRKYYEDHGIPYVQSGLSRFFWFIVGNGDIVSTEEEFYKDATAFENSKLVGLMDMTGVTNHYITDLDLLRLIYVKNFENFVNRRPIKTKETNKYLQRMLFSTESEQWKGIRTKLSPIFTTGKIKRMFQIFQNSSERLDEYLKTQIEYPKKNSMDIDFLQIFSKYSMDVIASCAFGIDSKSFSVKPDQRSTFEQMGTQFGFRFHLKFILKFIFVQVAPRIADFLKIDVMDSESQDYFSNVIKDVIKRRRQTGEKRNDFLQLMMEVQQGIVKADDESNSILNGDVAGDKDGSGSGKITSDKVEFDDDHIIANGLLFLMAGFDPTQSSLILTIYALAVEQEVQEKLYEEVKAAMEKNGGHLSYEAVNEMKYLDLVLSESARRYSPATRTERVCTKDFPVPGTDFVIEKGSIVVIPIHGFHQDPRYFPNPKQFIPERFTPENKAARHPYAYQPFGHGPRNCIGNRFALVKVKAAIAQLVYSFQFAPCAKTKIPLEFDRNPNIKPKGAMWLNITVRDN